jgi:hypothetical protein
VRVGRCSQPGTEVDQHRGRKPGGLLPGHRIGHPGRVPPARIEGERSAASRSLNPSSRCRTITTARIDGGTDRRPVVSNRSTNNSDGNSRAAPGRGTGTPTPRARLPHTSGHRQRAGPGGGAGGQGSQQVLRVRRQAARESVTTTGRGRITDRTASPELGLRLPLLPRTDRAFLTVCRPGAGPRRSARSRSGRSFSAQP